MEVSLEAELAELLTNLSEVQQELLEFLNEKRTLLVKSDSAGLAAIESTENALIARLQACHEHRGQLLDRATAEGIPSGDLTTLAKAIPDEGGKELSRNIHEAKARSRLLHHHSLTNWVLVQRTLIHLSQLLEIIATGGRPEPTYSKGKKRTSRGSLVDHAV